MRKLMYLLLCSVVILIIGTQVSRAATANVSGILSGNYTSTTTFIDNSTIFDVTKGKVTIEGSVDMTNIGSALIHIGLLDKRVYDAYVNNQLPDGSNATVAGFTGSTFNASATAYFYSTYVRMKDMDPESALLTKTASGPINFVHEVIMDGYPGYDPTGGADKQWAQTAGTYTSAPVGTQRMTIDGGTTWKEYAWGAWRNSIRDSFFDGSAWPEPELTYNGAYLAVTVFGEPTGDGVSYDATATGPAFSGQPIPAPAAVWCGVAMITALVGRRRLRL